jgi:membrane-associated phospholipid phosphatase
MVGGLGGGWQGGGWQGGGWQGGGWQGGGWQGGGWAGGGGSEGLYAMRTDRPLVAEDVSLPPPADGNLAPTFPLKAWDNDLFALTFLGDFFTAVVAGKTWVGASSWETDIITALTPFPNVVVPPAVATPADDSIDDLRILAVTERPEAMGEILNQHQNQQLCFMQLLMMTATSHPHTFFVMKLAARVGEVVMMRLKRHFNRPRPTQYFPTLYPPVPVPGHSAYPAGHALIAQLTANVLIEVTKKGTPPASPYRRSLLKLAANIGLNRVIAGFHFRSDISAGVTAADRTYQFLSGMPAGAPTPPHFSFASAMTAAKGEWP